MIILLCGVESLDPLLELVPLKGEDCLQISSEQDPQDYRLTVAEIVHKGEEVKVWVFFWKLLGSLDCSKGTLPVVKSSISHSE